TACRRSMSEAFEVSPITSAPRNGALQATAAAGDGGVTVVMPILFSTTGDGAVTATDRLPFPLSLPGRYSSSTAWKLVPPKPKALSPPRRVASAGIVHGFNSVLT